MLKRVSKRSITCRCLSVMFVGKRSNVDVLADWEGSVSDYWITNRPPSPFETVVAMFGLQL